MNLNLLPDALGLLYDHGIRECLRVFPELRPHTPLLLAMRWRETLLQEAEEEVQAAAEALERL